ncbi:uncharacterized protein WCC33_016712 [Rhinophrynus dorsalis]
MFHYFLVREDTRNYLRFLWYKNDDIDGEVTECRMKVHVFGNSPSPAVANYGLRRTAREGEEEYGKDGRNLVERDFYVDDGLKSVPTEEEAIDLLKQTQRMLATANLKLHKIASNNAYGRHHARFILGKAKLAPHPDHTIPRLELCGAVLAVELAELIENEIDCKLETIRIFTDSKVVLGYICNKKRRFYVYVANQVERIRKSTQPDQWYHVPTDQNPPDTATRSVPAACIQNSLRLTGPMFLTHETLLTLADDFELIDPDRDLEIRPQASVLLTNILPRNVFGSQRFHRFSRWTALLRAIANLRHIAISFHHMPDDKTNGCQGWHICKRLHTTDELTKAKETVLHHVQREMYAGEISCIHEKKSISKNSPLWKLNPFIDENGLIRIGGRLSKSCLSSKERLTIFLRTLKDIVEHSLISAPS